MFRSLLRLPALCSRLSAGHRPTKPCLMSGHRFLSMGGNEEKCKSARPRSLSELEKLLKKGSISGNDRQLWANAIQTAEKLCASSMSSEKVLELLGRNGFRVYSHASVKAFVSKALRAYRQPSHAVADQAILELLGTCAQVGVRLSNLKATDQDIVKELIGRMKEESITKDISSYCEYFYVLGGFRYPWKDLLREKRKGLLSCLKRFEAENNGESEKGRRRLIYGMEQLLILKQNTEDMDEGVRECYERLLMRELEEISAQRGSRKIREEDERMPIVYAILVQLRSLSKLRGEDRLSGRQLDLIYKGLKEEWQMRGMDSFNQVLVILALGEMGVNYKSLPKDIWSMMMEDLRKKMHKKITPVALSSLLKGWKCMGYKCKDMEEELKEAVLKAVVDLCRDERNMRGIANVMLYLGDMEADWEEDMKGGEREREILEGIGKASKGFKAQELSNTLLGLANMKASWKDMRGGVQQSLLDAIEDKCKEMNEQALSNTLYSLGQLGLRWKDVPSSLKEKLLDHLKQLLSSEKLKIIGMNGSMNGLNTMGYDWKNDVKVYKSMLRKIEGWYGERAKIRDINAESLPKLFYSLGEGKVQWEELRKPTKQALMNGMEAYCKGENVDAKKVSNMIYGLGNMGATIYNMPAVMKETLEVAVRKIVRKGYNAQEIANIMYSFSEMQYSWEMVGEETQKAFLFMIGRSSREFNAQELCNTCYSVAVMIRGNKGEWKKSYFLPLQESLLQRYYEIEKMSEGKGKGKEGSFSEEALSQLSVYLSWLETLPSSSLSSLLQSLHQDKLPDIKDPRITKPTSIHKRFSERLRVVWREMMEKEVREGKMSEERKEELMKMKVKIVDEYNGLRRKVFPVDVAVVEDVVGVGGEKEEKVWLLVEIDGDYHKHTVKEGNVKVLETVDQLKEYLYGEKYKGVPTRRYDVRSISNNCESVVGEVVKELWKKVRK